MTHLEGVPAPFVPMYWPHVEHWVASAVYDAANPWTSKDVLARILDRHMQLWVAWVDEKISGVFVTEIYDTARGMTCAIPVVGGEGLGKESLDVLDTIEAWAKEQGCVRLRGEGRTGWSRALKPKGWVKLTEQVEKVL
jgi:hypothetical protein